MGKLPKLYATLVEPWMQKREAINLEIGKWIKQQEEANRFNTETMSQMLTLINDQQKQINELKVRLTNKQ